MVLIVRYHRPTYCTVMCYASKIDGAVLCSVSAFLLHFPPATCGEQVLFEDCSLVYCFILVSAACRLWKRGGWGDKILIGSNQLDLLRERQDLKALYNVNIY